MLEQKIELLTAAVLALTETMKGGVPAAADTPSAAAPADKPKRGRPAATKAAAPEHSRSEMQAALNEVKENFDTATAKALIKAAGFDKMADVTEDKYDELYNAAKAKMGELDAGEGEDDGM